MSLINLGGDIARPIPQISLKNCPNSTNMNIIQPSSIFDLEQEIEEGGGFLDSTTYASNGLENRLSLICTNIKLFL